MSAVSPHSTSVLEGGYRHHDDELGQVIAVSAGELPILRNLSIRRLTLTPNAIRVPHWHANADELTYCVRGNALVSALDSGSVFSSFLIGPGEMFHIASGSLHHIENVGDHDAEFIVALRHEQPQDFGLASSFGAMSDAVLGNTYDQPSAAFTSVKRSTTEPAITRRHGEAEIPAVARYGDQHKFDLEAQSPPISGVAGTARLARADTWPVLENIAMYSLRITTEGMREPHWHPATAEMGYLRDGSARMTIMDPDGALDTWTLQPGDVYFIPPGFPHHIENIGRDNAHLLVFFDRAMPADIGYRASASAYPPPVLEGMFASAPTLPELPFTPQDPLLVDRINPVDPITEPTTD